MYDIEQMFEDGNMKERKRAMAKKETYDAGAYLFWKDWKQSANVLVCISEVSLEKD